MVQWRVCSNGKAIPGLGLSNFQGSLQASNIHHSISVLQITNVTCTDGYFMLLFNLTPEPRGVRSHTSHPVNGCIRIVLKLCKSLPETSHVYLIWNMTIPVALIIRELPQQTSKNGYNAETVYNK